MVACCGLMTGGKQDTLTRMTVDEPELPGEIITSHPVPILRTRHMLEIISGHLAFHCQFSSTHINHSNTGSIFFRA